MKESSRPIIEHIPFFLNYCKEMGLSEKTFENYKRFLNKFILWLKKKNKSPLLPHELTTEDIKEYRLYLSSYKNNKRQSLKPITQNYYLIALRALLSYFVAKDVVSPPSDKIRLQGGLKTEKKVNYLNKNQIYKLINTPNINNPIGLRDRTILEVLISSGLKIAQLKNLNRFQIEEKISGESLASVKEYLKSRKDDNTALFINYRCRKNADRRLTVRSIERMVSSYGRKINLPFLVTPEILRWARAHALLNEEIKIYKPLTHKTFVVKNYGNKESIKTPISSQENEKDLSSTWHIVENFINKEILWLKDSIPTLSYSYKENPPFLKHDDSILRKIAILIVDGKVKATEFRDKDENKDLWDNLTKKGDLNKINRHGQEWHKKMMDVIYEYFKLRNCKITLEPALNYGRADLGIYSNPNSPLYIEVGTVSLFKLWYNFSTIKNVTFLIVPSENKIIEFNT